MIDLRKKKDFTAEVFTSAMNDIMFFLMLFFIITSTLLNPSMIKVSLPKSQSSQTLQKKEINLTMTKEKIYFVNNTQVSYDASGGTTEKGDFPISRCFYHVAF